MPIPLRIVHEDKDLLVLDKPAGMVVHPAAGHSRDTLVNALLHHCKDLSGIGCVLRPGIVHRLDKGTSGLLVVAKNDVSHLALARQFHEHSILREYLGLVRGDLKGNQGSIAAPIGRHVRDRKKMSTRTLRGRDAITLWRVERRYRSYTLVRFTLKTGRTHQIRVHMKELGHPIVGDPVYGARTGRGTRAGMDDNRTDKLAQLERPFLHAEKLGFQHPRSSLFLQFIAPLPPELEEVLQQLAQDRSP
jgi:23S rRNA pseudouridine1911/1915/1917 synthase